MPASLQTSDNPKQWSYPPGMDIMASGTFWQNYSGKYFKIQIFEIYPHNIQLLLSISESLAQEMEFDRKARESDVKVQERPSFYKNSVLYTSAT